jgi:HD-GYP domain-containing protein (c-di-GMP phosphodiesterase class II)
MTMACDHSGSRSGGARYVHGQRQLRLVVVCDHCGAECAELERLAYAPDARRFAGHLAELTARELGLDETRVARVRFAALICAKGRDQIPLDVLDKQGPLTADERTLVRGQPELGAALFSEANFDDIREWILCLRERPDGRGYPRGLSAERIPAEARILAVTEAYASMSSDRPYRPARDHEDACRELLRCAGTQFDSAVVQAFVHASERRNVRLAPAA